MTFGRPRGAAIASIICLLLIGSACSEEVPTNYTAAHREAFLAACSRPLDDPRLLSDVCGCVYDRIEDEVPFDEFQQMSERLAGAAASSTSTTVATASSAVVDPLPDDIAHLVADCFETEADL